MPDMKIPQFKLSLDQRPNDDETPVVNPTDPEVDRKSKSVGGNLKPRIKTSAAPQVENSGESSKSSRAPLTPKVRRAIKPEVAPPADDAEESLDDIYEAMSHMSFRDMKNLIKNSEAKEREEAKRREASMRPLTPEEEKIKGEWMRSVGCASYTAEEKAALQRQMDAINESRKASISQQPSKGVTSLEDGEPEEVGDREDAVPAPSKTPHVKASRRAKKEKTSKKINFKVIRRTIMGMVGVAVVAAGAVTASRIKDRWADEQSFVNMMKGKLMADISASQQSQANVIKIYDSEGQFLNSVNTSDSTSLTEVPATFLSFLQYKMIGSADAPRKLGDTTKDRLLFTIKDLFNLTDLSDYSDSLGYQTANLYLHIIRGYDRPMNIVPLARYLDKNVDTASMLYYIASAAPYGDSKVIGLSVAAETFFGKDYHDLDKMQQLYTAAACCESFYTPANFCLERDDWLTMAELPNDDIAYPDVWAERIGYGTASSIYADPVISNLPKDLESITTGSSDVLLTTSSNLQKFIKSVLLEETTADINLDTHGNYTSDFSCSVFSTDGSLLAYVPTRNDEARIGIDTYTDLNAITTFRVAADTISARNKTVYAPLSDSLTLEGSEPAVSAFKSKGCLYPKEQESSAYSIGEYLVTLRLSSLGQKRSLPPYIRRVTDKLGGTVEEPLMLTALRPLALEGATAWDSVLALSGEIPTGVAPCVHFNFCDRVNVYIDNSYIITVACGTKAKGGSIALDNTAEVLSKISDRVRAKVWEGVTYSSIEPLRLSPAYVSAMEQQRAVNGEALAASLNLDAYNSLVIDSNEAAITFQSDLDKAIESIKGAQDVISAASYNALMAKIDQLRSSHSMELLEWSAN